MAEIVLDRVSKVFDDGFEAVKEMNLDIEDGEFMILVGPSGCGKSTALRMIAGLEDISSGELKIGGEVVNDRSPKDRDIAMVFQNYALYPHMTRAREHGLRAEAGQGRQGRDRQEGRGGGRDARPRPSTSTASRPTSPAASASGWRWGGRSSATRRSS